MKIKNKFLHNYLVLVFPSLLTYLYWLLITLLSNIIDILSPVLFPDMMYLPETPGGRVNRGEVTFFSIAMASAYAILMIPVSFLINKSISYMKNRMVREDTIKSITIIFRVTLYLIYIFFLIVLPKNI